MLSVPNCEIVMICALWKGKEMGCVLIYHWVHEWDMNIWISNKQVNDFSWTGLIIVANYINIRRYQLPYFIRGLWGYSAPSCSNTLHCAYIQSSTGNLTNFALFSLLIYLQIISTIISAHSEHSHFQFNINKGNANLASNFLANLHNFCTTDCINDYQIWGHLTTYHLKCISINGRFSQPEFDAINISNGSVVY